MANVRQLSFAGGEIAPSLYARTDQQRYANALRTCRNCMIRKEGGATNRPGFQFIAEVKDSTKRVRLMKFVFNDDETYILEVGDRYIRFIQDRGQVVVFDVAGWLIATDYTVGDLVQRGGGHYYATTAHTSAATTEPGNGATWQTVWYLLTALIYEIPTPYLEADLPALQYVQSGDIITIVHPSYAPSELRRYDHTRWTFTTIRFGPSIAKPTSVSASGGAAGTRHWAVTAVDAADEESLPGLHTNANGIGTAAAPVTLTWTPPPGAISHLVYRSTDGVSYGFIGKTTGLGVLRSDTSFTDTDETASTSSVGTWVAAAGQVRNDIDLTNGKAQDGKYKIYGKIELSVTGGGTATFDGRVRAYYKRSSDAVRIDAGIIATEGVTNFSGNTGLVAIVPVNIDVPASIDYVSLQIDLVPEVRIAAVIAGTPTANCRFNTATAPDNKIEFTTATASFQDTGQVADFDLEPPTHPNIFTAPNEYPSTVSYYQQRQLVANTNANPETVWASRIAGYTNFGTSHPLQDDDAITFRLVGEHVNAVRHLVDFGKNLVAFTSGGEWIIDGDEAGILLPTAINASEYTSHGAHEDLAPFKIGRTVLYVQARGSLVRDFFKDLAEEFTGGDLTVYAAHLFEGKEIVDWDYQEVPHSIVWCVRDDGVLLGLTYIRQHEIMGWHRHDTQGLFENVCTIPEGTENAVYAVIQRTIDGVDVRYIEAMKSRFFESQDDMFFVDSGISYNGWNTGATTLTLSGGTNWTVDEELTLTASVAIFSGADVGKTYVLVDDDTGDRVSFVVSTFTSTTVLEGFADKTVPVSLRGIGTTTWALAESTVAGLDHLEGESVSVLGDGFVEGSALRSDYDEIVVTGGTVTLSRPYAVIHVGLPYIADVETLDIEMASGPSNKQSGKQAPTKVGAYFEKTRGVFVGRKAPTGVNPIADLDEFKRSVNSDINFPDNLISEYKEINLKGKGYDFHGRVLIRQVDPLPMTVLAVVTQGYLSPPAG